MELWDASTIVLSDTHTKPTKSVCQRYLYRLDHSSGAHSSKKVGLKRWEQKPPLTPVPGDALFWPPV